MMGIIKKTIYYITNRYLLFFILLFVLILLNWYFTGNILPSPETKNIWFYSGIFMVLFSFIFIEPYFTSPKNVITNVLPLFLIYLSVQDSFKDPILWLASIIFLLLLIVTSIFSTALYVDELSPTSKRNLISNYLKRISVFFGKGDRIFSIVFLTVIFSYNTEVMASNSHFASLIILWGIILSIKPNVIHNTFKFKKDEIHKNALGEIFRVHSEKMFLVKLFDDKIGVEKFDLVEFKYNMDKSKDIVKKGFIFDTYFLNKQKWARVLALKNKKEVEKKLNSNLIYEVKNQDKDDLKSELKIDSFVGVIIENSEIESIKFEYSQKVNDIQEGDLLELQVGNKTIYYQVSIGITEIENLDNKEESGLIEGEAIQLGTWNIEDQSFEKYGWVPEINTPIFKADTDKLDFPEIKLPEYKLGNIPNTKFPSIINLDEVISHHLALLGVTGSGKSFLARELIKEMLNDTKVIVVDFTGEWKKKLKDLTPQEIIESSNYEEVEEKFSNDGYKDKVKIALNEKISKFMKLDENLGLFEIPDLSNTSFILEITQLFLESVFNYAKKHEGNRICLVLEEAHTVIPETNFLGDLGDYGSSKALVSKMSQIALQGRKYNVGLMVIAQRTANVSKTVLTQCNTVVCFQAFDETSYTFLGNYIGKKLIKDLSSLKKYHAVVTGKAIKSKIPMIVNLER